MILTPNLQTTLFKQSSKLNFEDKSCVHYLFKSVGGTTKYENPGENTDLHYSDQSDLYQLVVSSVVQIIHVSMRT